MTELSANWLSTELDAIDEDVAKWSPGLRESFESHSPPARKGDWVQTFTGRQFWPVDPRPEEVCIEDIAHALSMCCRYGGHVKRFYSVAEHSVHVCRAAPPKLRRTALLHDASEAYLVDVPRPLKRSLPGYVEIEDRLMAVIADRFGLAWPLPPEIKDLDNRILLDERAALMGKPAAPWGYEDLKPLGVEIKGWEPWFAKAMFLREFERLSNGS